MQRDERREKTDKEPHEREQRRKMNKRGNHVLDVGLLIGAEHGVQLKHGGLRVGVLRGRKRV